MSVAEQQEAAEGPAEDAVFEDPPQPLSGNGFGEAVATGPESGLGALFQPVSYDEIMRGPGYEMLSTRFSADLK